MAQRQWVERNDNVPGWVYLIQAEGYHGIVPGVYLKRCKIGLTRSVENRLATLHSSQPPCDYKVIKAIYVEDMATVESALHAQFKHCNIKLEKSREWFDLNPWQYAMVLWAFTRYDSHRVTIVDMPKRAIAGSIIALIGVGVLLGYLVKFDAPKTQPADTLQKVG